MAAVPVPAAVEAKDMSPGDAYTIHRNETYPKHLHTNWRKMKIQTLRRYVRFHKLTVSQDSSPKDYTVAVARHFEGTKKEAPQVLRKFLSVVKREIRNGSPSWRSAGADTSVAAIRSNATRKPYQPPQPPGSDLKRRRAVVPSSTTIQRKDSGSSGATAGKRRRADDPNLPKKVAVKGEGDFTGESIEVFWGPPHNRWFKAYVKDFNLSKKGFSTLIYKDNTEEYAKLLPNGVGKALGDGGKMEDMKWRQKRKSSIPDVSPATYKDMIKKALADLSRTNGGDMKGTFKEICQAMKRLYAKKLNWKASGDARRTPVWKSSVRKILFAHYDFKRVKGPGANGAHVFTFL